MPKRNLPFLMTIGLFGLGITFTASILDPFIYTEKVSLLAPPAFKNTTLSLITISALLVALFVQPLIGRWSDRTQSRWGKRIPYLIAGVLGLSFSLSFIILTNSLWSLILAVMAASASANTVQSVWQAILPEHVPPTQHGTAVGVKTLLELIGIVIGVSLGLTLLRTNLWLVLLIALSLLLTILLITIWVIPTATTVTKLVHPFDFKNPLSLTALNLGQAPGFLWWMLNRFLFWSAAIAIRTFLLNYLKDVFGLSLIQAQALNSRLAMILGIGVFLLVLPVGVIADRIGRQPLLIVAGLMAGSGALVFVLLRDLSLLFMAGGLIAGGAGIFAGASWTLATDLAPKTEAALYLALANAATIIGSIGGRLGGVLIDGVNQMTGTLITGYVVVFGIAAFFFMSSSLVVLKIPRT